MQGDFLINLDERVGVSSRMLRLAGWFLRVALAAAFASAVADRFGVWGPPGTPGVAWGNVERFNAYVARLNWFLPASLIGTLAWAVTVAEMLFALVLLIGWRLRWTALLTSCLLLLFGVTMAVTLGPKTPLDYCVFTAAAAAFLLFAIQPADSTRELK